MINFKKEYKQLCRIYDKKLMELHRTNFDNFNNNIGYFVTYLRFLRDYYILTEPLTIEDKENPKIATIMTAVAEYDQSQKCAAKYFEKTDAGIKLLIEGTKEEVMKKYQAERDLHWISFWQTVAFNIEDWTRGNNATIQQNNIA